MEYGYELLGILGAILGTWVFNNTKLREGVTEWVVSNLGKKSYNTNNHNIKTTLKSLKFEAQLTTFDNESKTKLYHYYVHEFLTKMNDLVCELINNKKLNFNDIKRYIKNNMYDTLIELNKSIDNNITLPDEINEKFTKFRSYLTLQYTYAIEHALQAPSKKILLIQVLDAIENNSRWFLFYCTEMFNSFNGKFDDLQISDIFKNIPE